MQQMYWHNCEYITVQMVKLDASEEKNKVLMVFKQCNLFYVTEIGFGDSFGFPWKRVVIIVLSSILI